MTKTAAELESMARFAVAVFGEAWDRTDQMVSSAQINRLSDEDKKVVRARIKQIARERMATRSNV